MNKSLPIYDFIPIGRERAVPLSFIMSHFHMNNRECRKEIELERAQGAPILSALDGKGGYFRPANAHEAARFAVSQRSRAAQILKSARAAEAAAAELRRAEMDNNTEGRSKSECQGVGKAPV